MEKTTRTIIDLNIDYTLPVISHSVGIVTRAPTSGVNDQKFMPDYSGILELPGSLIKNNGLASGIPFKCYPNHEKLSLKREIDYSRYQSYFKARDCLLVRRYLDFQISQSSSSSFSTIHAIAKDLFINSIDEIGIDLDPDVRHQRDTENLLKATQFSYNHYSHNIRNLKHNTQLNDKLLLIFDKGIKILQLKQSHVITNESTLPSNQSNSDDNSSQNDNATRCIRSINDKSNFLVKDACLNKYNGSILGIASDLESKHTIKFYDTQHSKRPYHEITWESEASSAYPPEIQTVANGKRIFLSLETMHENINQLNCIPSHLVNMLLTSSYSISVIDPRHQELGMCIIKKSKSHSFYPMEKIICNEFSNFNDHQFYCLSDSFLRVFDMRYPGVAVNQLNHMLDITQTNHINMKLVSLNNNTEKLESVCMSTPNNLSFATFEKPELTQLINPRSKHQPIHESNPLFKDEQYSELYGLSIMNYGRKEGDLFTVAQLTSKGDLLLREFHSTTGNETNQTENDRCYNESILRWNHINELLDKSVCNLRSDINIRDLDDVEIPSSPLGTEAVDFIDIMSKHRITELTQSLDSPRAKELFKEMVEKMNILP